LQIRFYPNWGFEKSRYGFNIKKGALEIESPFCSFFFNVRG
jgi:hypothetical protein